MNAAHQKVAASHLSRDAYLYVRQSTQRQVFDHGESTRRQYALRERAVALGWPTERVVVIDSDLGLSGADSDREGFQHLVAEVGMGRAGIVLGLEVSRLARNSTDWHRLLEICALSETLILDEDGVYDPVVRRNGIQMAQGRASARTRLQRQTRIPVRNPQSTTNQTTRAKPKTRTFPRSCGATEY